MSQAKAVVVSGLLLLFVLILSSCAAPSSMPAGTFPPTEAPATVVPVPEEPTAVVEAPLTITLALPFENPKVIEAKDILNSSATSQYKLEVVIIDNYREKLFADFAAEQAPDLIWMSPEWLPEFVARETLMDVTERLNGEHDAEQLNDYFPMPLQSFQLQGKQYGLPWRADPIMLYVNTDDLAAAGLEPNVNDWSWETFLDTCKQLTTNDHYGLAVNNFWSVPIWAWQGGGDLGFYQAMSDVLLNNHDCTPKEEEVEAFGGIRTMIQVNRVSMIMDLASFSHEENSAITAFILPKGPSNQATSAAVTGLSINKNTAQPDLAYRAFLDLAWTVQKLDAYTPRRSLVDNSTEWQQKLTNQPKVARSADNIYTNFQEHMSVPVPLSSVWQPYPPSLTPPIGDAELVPGAAPMVAGVNQLDALLRAAGTRINLARTVRLEDAIGTAYLAPPDRDANALRSRAEFEEQARQQGVIVGVAVIERGSELHLVPGAYALRVRLVGDKWMLDYISPDTTEPALTMNVEVRDYSPFDDDYPTAAIFIGSKDGEICIPGTRLCIYLPL